MYGWLSRAFLDFFVVSPEFPTGNGQVDLVLQTISQKAIIEIKSFTSTSKLKHAKTQAAGYAKKMNLTEVMLVVFALSQDQEIMTPFTGESDEGGVRVIVEAIGK